MTVSQMHNARRFPPVHLADKSGLLAVGGALTPDWLIDAYSQGIFPWYSDGEPLMWWSPDPRMVLFPGDLKVSKSMRNILNQRKFFVRFDTAFEDVISACAKIQRPDQTGTWITREMMDAYGNLHELGVAHSVEVINPEGELVGGLYGVALGGCFFGESMFSKVSNASKTGFIALVQWLRENNFSLIDCQMSTGHLASLGAHEIPRSRFVKLLKTATSEKGVPGKWNYAQFPSYQSR